MNTVGLFQKRIVEDGLLDITIVGDLLQPGDADKPWVTSNNNYCWHRAVAQVFQPKKILEIGTRFGYSLKAMVDGAGHPREEYTLYSVDCEHDGLPCNVIVSEYFDAFNLHQIPAKTHDCRTLRITEMMDLCHVDANDTDEDTYHNCVLAIESLRHKGVMLVDDLDNAGVLAGVQRFCKDYGLNYTELPTLHRMAFIVNDAAWRNSLECLFMDHDHAQKRCLIRLLQDDMTVLDVGSHQGEYLRIMAPLVEQVIAFEPCLRDYRFLEATLDHENVELERLALGARNGSADLHICDRFEAYGYNSLFEPDEGHAWMPFHVEPVKMQMIDYYLDHAGIDRVHFVKLDIEGAELEFLRGADKLLASKPSIMCELSPTNPSHAGAVASYLIERGYVWHGITEKGLLHQSLDPKANAAVQDFVAIAEVQ